MLQILQSNKRHALNKLKANKIISLSIVIKSFEHLFSVSWPNKYNNNNNGKIKNNVMLKTMH